jgi:RNA polymerase sigma-70 factor (ECF subfamily)
MITEVQFAAEFQEWNGRMIGSLRKKGFSEHSAEDIVQNTWLKAWRFLEQYRGEAKFSTWVFNILLNEIKTHLRDKHARHCEPLDNFDLLAAPVSETEENERRLTRVLEDLEQLPEIFREVVRMRLLGFSDKEIASATGLQVPAIKSRVFRGVRQLAQMKGAK